MRDGVREGERNGHLLLSGNSPFFFHSSRKLKLKRRQELKEPEHRAERGGEREDAGLPTNRWRERGDDRRERERGRVSSRLDGCNPIIVNDTLFWERESERRSQEAGSERESETFKESGEERESERDPLGIKGAGLICHALLGGVKGGVVIF